ncbi:MAG: outer membrane beta-barrel protein [Bacteroidales bacterium]|nr:outer membrane beta-barrel protein [Bacteroidales bacterium]NLM92528.1 PorT family protein [Bacteroidales bacterium]
MKHRKLIAVGFFLFLFFFSGTQSLIAQRKAFSFQNREELDFRPYHFGFSLGFNQMNFALKPAESLRELNNDNPGDPTYGSFYTVRPEPDLGFHIGIISNLKITSMLDLRFVPTLAFGDRSIVYEYQKATSNQVDAGVIKQKFEVTTIEFPLHLKFKSVRINNARAYVLGGFKFSTDLSSNEYKDEGNEGTIYSRSAKNDFHYELGLGFDYYFPYFKFSTEIKAAFGLQNLIRKGAITYPMFHTSIDRLNSKSIMISFLFE